MNMSVDPEFLRSRLRMRSCAQAQAASIRMGIPSTTTGTQQRVNAATLSPVAVAIGTLTVIAKMDFCAPVTMMFTAGVILPVPSALRSTFNLYLRQTQHHGETTLAPADSLTWHPAACGSTERRRRHARCLRWCFGQAPTAGPDRPLHHRTRPVLIC